MRHSGRHIWASVRGYHPRKRFLLCIWENAPLVTGWSHFLCDFRTLNDRWGFICILPYHFYNLISNSHSNFHPGFVVLSAFVQRFTPLCICCILFSPPSFRWPLWGLFNSISQAAFDYTGTLWFNFSLFFKSYDVSGVKKRFRVICCLYMTIYVRASLMTGHCPSQRVPQSSADALYSGGDTRRDTAGR